MPSNDAGDCFQARSIATELLVENRAALSERHAERLYSSSCHDTVGCTTSRPSASRSSVAELLGEQQRMAQRRDHRGQRDRGCVEVAAAIALASTIESGHGVAGSWLPGAA